MNLQEKAFENCKNILIHNYKISKENKTIIFYDENTTLSKLLLEGYSKALDSLGFDFESYNFHAIAVEEVLDITSKLKEKDLVILILRIIMGLLVYLEWLLLLKVKLLI